MQVEAPPTFLTMHGVCRQTNVCLGTLKRRIADGMVKPDAILVEAANRPGSLLFLATHLPEIASALATKPK